MKQIQCVIFFFLIFIHSAQAATVGFATAAGGLGDNGFNDMTYTGLRKAQQRYGFRLVLAEAEKTGIAGETELKNIIEQSETVVFLGDQYKDLGKMNALKYPEKRFLILDIEMKDLPNLVSPCCEAVSSGEFLYLDAQRCRRRRYFFHRILRQGPGSRPLRFYYLGD